MTWGVKVQRVAFSLSVLALLALASGASYWNWLDALAWLDW
jgi:hypothetical protein